MGEECRWRQAEPLIRLHLIVEGQTEETFVRDLLALDLASYNVISDVHRVTTGKRRGKLHRGGLVSYAHLRRDILLWSSQDRNPDARFTSMIDLYQIPRDFPELKNSADLRGPIQRAEYLETAFFRDVSDPRFIPFIQVHEFEALLFSDPSAFAVAFPGRTAEALELERIRSGFASPEHINDGESTSPSKRICAVFPDYEKAVFSSLIASHIGLDLMARKCAHFGQWLDAMRELR